MADACVQCGLCLPHCPTYQDARSEPESPRGRILLGRAIAEGRIAAAEADRDDALGHCLGCRACEAVCPAKVDYGRILHLTRSALRAEQPPRRWQRLLEWGVGRPRVLDAGFRLARWLRPLPWLRNRLPSIPRVRPLRPRAATGTPRGRLLLVQGCVAAHWERPAHAAALQLLSRLGWEVDVLEPGCCGALHRHAGNAGDAARLRERLATAIASRRCEAVLHAGGGCHEAIGEAAGQLPTHELSAFIAGDSRLPGLRLRSSSLRVALHVACTQRNVVRRADADQDLLLRIPGLRLCPPAPARCCGAAGVQSLQFPGQSSQRMKPISDWYRDAAPDLLLAGNLGCRLQLARGLGSGSGTLEVQHPLEFLVGHLE
nr:(Fe-S)-binding protein [Lysobacter sp. CAU 1642]